MSRFLDPAVLAAISGLDLVAKTVVDGFVAGLHRSPDFGFSQEFAEYRAYTPGDDLRHVDWNVFARTERMYLKRYRGETNSLLTLLLDASNSMNFSSHAVAKMSYARYLAAALCYLAIRAQRDAAGLLVFDDEVRDYMRPSTRQGQLQRLFAGLELAEPRARTSFDAPMQHLQAFLQRRGIVVIFSDFYAAPEAIIRRSSRCASTATRSCCSTSSTRARSNLIWAALPCSWTWRPDIRIEVNADYVAREYQPKIAAHIQALRDGAQRAGMSYQLLVTDRPLDGALREYLTIRQSRRF